MPKNSVMLLRTCRSDAVDVDTHIYIYIYMCIYIYMYISMPYDFFNMSDISGMYDQGIRCMHEV